ncbi:MAG: TetR/AcrR family transcriptional regulator [Sciscionella sp.]
MPSSRTPVFGPQATTRRRRLTPDEVRERVLRTACELTTEAGGLTVSPATVNFELIVQRADVPRSAVYRIWASKDDFMIEFLRYFVRENKSADEKWWGGTAAFDPQTIEVVRAVVYQRSAELDTVSGRRAVLREAVRQGAKQNFAAVLTSPHWRTYVALNATVNSIPDPDTKAELHATLCEADKSYICKMVAFYRGMGSVLGIRPPPSLRYEHFAAAGAAIVEGLVLRHVLNPELVVEDLTVPGPDGEPESWCLAALGFLGLTETLLEEDPTFPDELPADPDARIHWLDTRITEALTFTEPTPAKLIPIPELEDLVDM